MSPYYLDTKSSKKGKPNLLIEILIWALPITNLIYASLKQGVQLKDIAWNLFYFLILNSIKSFYRHFGDQLAVLADIFKWMIPLIGAIFIIPGAYSIYLDISKHHDPVSGLILVIMGIVVMIIITKKPSSS